MGCRSRLWLEPAFWLLEAGFRITVRPLLVNIREQKFPFSVLLSCTISCFIKFNLFRKELMVDMLFFLFFF